MTTDHVIDPSIPSHRQAEKVAEVVRDALNDVDRTVLMYVIVRELAAFDDGGEDPLRSFFITGVMDSGFEVPGLAMFPEPAASDPVVAPAAARLAHALAAVPITD